VASERFSQWQVTDISYFGLIHFLFYNIRQELEIYCHLFSFTFSRFKENGERREIVLVKKKKGSMGN